MAQDQLPIKITIIPPSSAEVNTAMAAIEARIKASGRMLATSANKQANEEIRANQRKNNTQKSADKKALTDRNKMYKAMGQQRLNFMKAETQAHILNNQKKNTILIAADKKAAKARRAASSEGVYQAAGIKGSGTRLREIKALKTAQMQLRMELKRGIITRMQYNTMLSDTHKRMNLLQRGNVRARGAIHQLIAKTASLTFEMTGAVFGIVAMGAALSSPALIGVGFLRKMEDTKLGITGIMLAMGEMNGEALTFEQGWQVAEEQIDRLAMSAMRLSGTLTDFTKSFQAILAPGMAAGMNLDEIRKIATAGTVAVKTIGLDARQVVQEIRDLVAGGIQAASSTLATSLGLKDSDIKKAKLSAQGLYTFLIDKLQGFETAAERRDQTLSGKMEQTWEAFVIGMSKVSEPVFKSLKGFFDDIFDIIGKFEGEGVDEIFVFNEEFLDGIRSYVSFLADVLDGLKLVVLTMYKWKDEAILLLKLFAGFKILKFANVWIGDAVLAIRGMIVSQQYSLGIETKKTTLLAEQVGLRAALNAQTGAGAATQVGAGLFATLGLGNFAAAFKKFFTKGAPAILATFGRVALAAIPIVGLLYTIVWGAYSMFDFTSDTDKMDDKLKKLTKGSRDYRIEVSKGLKESARKALEAQNALVGELEARVKWENARDGGAIDDNETGDSSEDLAAALKERDRLLVVTRETAAAYLEVAEANNNYSASIKRMNGDLINARKAMQAVGSPVLKGIENAEKSISLATALIALEVQRGVIRKNQAALTPDEREKPENVLKLQGVDDQLAVIEMSLKANRELAKLKAKSKDSTLSSFQRDLAKDELTNAEKALELKHKFLKTEQEIVRYLVIKQDFLDKAKKAETPEKRDELLGSADRVDRLVEELEVQTELDRVNEKGLKNVDTRTAKQEGWNEKLREATHISRDYAKSVEDRTALETLELENAGKSPLQIAQLGERLKMEKALLDVKDKYIKLINATGVDGYEGTSEIDLRARQLVEEEKINLTLEERLILMELLSDKSKTFSQGQARAGAKFAADAADNAKFAEDAYDILYTNATSSMVAYFETGEGALRAFTKSVLDALQQIIVKKLIAGIFGQILAPAVAPGSDPTGAGASGFDSGGVDGLGFAKGGVFDPTGLVAFAKGGVVNSPTMFPFAKGTGLMGEAGPEAIMPLSRTTSGDLGVKVSGGEGGGMTNNINVNVSVESDGSSTTEVNSGQNSEGMKSLGKMIGVRVQEELIKQKRPGGLLSR